MLVGSQCIDNATGILCETGGVRGLPLKNEKNDPCHVENLNRSK